MCYIISQPDPKTRTRRVSDETVYSNALNIIATTSYNVAMATTNNTLASQCKPPLKFSLKIRKTKQFPRNVIHTQYNPLSACVKNLSKQNIKKGTTDNQRPLISSQQGQL